MTQKILLIAAGLCGLAASSQAQTYDPSLVAWYKFDEGAGAATALNAVAGSSTGAVQSGVTTGVAGISGNAYQFNNSTGYVDMGNANFFSSINATGQLTFSVWINTTIADTGRNVAVFAGLDTSSQSYTDLGFTRSEADHLGEAYGRNRPNLSGGGAQQTGIFSNGIVVNNGSWHHLALTVDLSTALLSLYVDGALANTQTMGTVAFPAFNNFEVGRLGRSAPTDYFGGLIDDVQVYNSALTASQINWLYNNPGEALLTAVPEPTTVGMAVAAGLGLIVGLRRRHRHNDRKISNS